MSLKAHLVAGGFALAALNLGHSEASAQPHVMRLEKVQVNVGTMVQFGPYLNCMVTNPFARPIVIQSYQFALTGYLGPAFAPVVCVNACVVGPGQTSQFSGPPNDPRITAANCSVNYVFL